MLGSVADTITDAGHNVTVLMPIIDVGERSRTGLKSTKKVIFVEPAEKVTQMFGEMKAFMSNLWVENSNNPVSMIMKAGKFSELLSSQCEKVLADSKLLDQMRNEKFDLGVAEPFDACAYAFFEAINIRAHVAVFAASRYDHASDVIGQSAAPSWVPGTQSSFGEKMTLSQRFVNLLQGVGGSYMFSKVGDYEFEQAQKIVPIKRSWREVLPEATFVFANMIPILEFPAPTLPKIIPVGGLSVKVGKQQNKLDEKWDKVLGVRKQNVLISFGSNAKSNMMPEEFKKSLLTVFASMPDTTFIWKYEDETDTLADHLDNVYLGNWLPQNELLADARLTLFMTHGGLASVTELAMMGKPCIMVPLFADQHRNAQMMKRHGGALVLQKSDLKNSELIRETIQKVFSNPEFKKNAEILAEKLNNQPTDPKQTLVKHVEFAARFGKQPTMDPYGRHLSFIQYFMLDIAFIGISIFLVSSYVFVKIICFFFCRKSSKPNAKKLQ